jgi:hypothetical protein
MRWRWLLFRRVFPHLLLRAGAEQISVTKGIIDAANGGGSIYWTAGHPMAHQPVAGYRHAASDQP